MSLEVPVFVQNVPIRPLQRKVQWYEFTPSKVNGFFDFVLSQGRKPIGRIDIFLGTKLIQSTSPTDAPEFDIQTWKNFNASKFAMEPRGAIEFSNIDKFFINKDDVIYVRIEAELPAAFRFSLNRCHILDLSESIGLVVDVCNSTRLIVDQGRQPCNFRIDFGKILSTDFTLSEHTSKILSVPISADASVEWSYVPGRDIRIRSIELSTIVPYKTNIRIVRSNG